MGRLGFQGIRLPLHKVLKDLPLTAFPVPEVVYVPLLQHNGEIGQVCVKRNDQVKVGDPLCNCSDSRQVPVHSPVSGVVKGVEEKLLSTGRLGSVVVIENDGNYDKSFEVGRPNPEDYTAAEIRTAVHQAGIVGLGGGVFPTSIKLSPNEPLEAVILNGCEGEPVLSADHRVMMERTDLLSYGIKAIQIATGAKRMIVAVEGHERECARHLRQSLSNVAEVAVVPPVYPVSAEGCLIKAVLKKKFYPGMLPSQVGAGVINVSTAVAIGEALRDGMPLIKRVVSVAGGAVKKPGNYLVPIGALISDVLKYVEAENPQEVILGGPMMGQSIPSLEVPVCKGTIGILALDEAEVNSTQPLACVNCGKCVEVCPVDLVPTHLAKLISKGKVEEAQDWGLKTCMECGSCAYVCPSHIPLVQWFRTGKLVLNHNEAIIGRGVEYGVHRKTGTE
jgi:electron transport complex protein RnfC